MLGRLEFWLSFLLVSLSAAQQNCYFAAGSDYRAPSNVVPCLNGDGYSSCCLQGDTCLAGGACYNFDSGNVYQYGCSDSSYEDESCPRKCDWDPDRSPWIAMEYCDDVDNVEDTWICHSPESCGCDWNVSSWGMLKLTARGCKAMGSDARVALYAPPTLTPYLKLPATNYGSTGYWNMTVTDGTTTWGDNPANGYTPSSIGPWTTYSDMPTTIILVEAGVTPSPSTLAAPSAVSSGSTSGPTGLTSASSETFTSTVASTTPAPTSSTPTPTPTPTSSGLSTGAKAGIGVGAAGGACGIVALAVAAWMMRRRKQKQNQNPPAPPPMQQQYSQGPPTPGVPPYNSHDKIGWQGAYPPGGPQNPYYNHGQMSPGYQEQPYREVPGIWSESPKPQMHSPPMELPAERGLHEIGSEASVASPSPLPSPTPAYSEIETQGPNQR